jgi:hypothetical protein
MLPNTSVLVWFSDEVQGCPILLFQFGLMIEYSAAKHFCFLQFGLVMECSAAKYICFSLVWLLRTVLPNPSVSVWFND